MVFQRSGKGPRATIISLAIMLLAYPSLELSAQNPSLPISVSGTVRGKSGEPVAGATVFLDDKSSAAHVEAKTSADGTFVLSPDRPGTYTARAEKSNLRGRSKEPLVLAVGEKKHLDLVLTDQAATPAMEFKDEPDFTVAGVTDWSNLGLHGSDATSRTSEALAKETLTLKSSGSEKGSASTHSNRYDLVLAYKAKGDLAGAREQVRKLLAAAD